MKVEKNIKSKLLISFILLILMFIIGNNIYAYEIRNIVRTKDQVYENGGAPSTFPTMVYKKQVAAYADTITKYKNGWANKFNGASNSNAYNVSSDGWVYDTNSPQDSLVDETYNHTNPRSFSRVYEYFHKYQNSIYDSTTSKGNTTKYYATGDLWPQTYIIGISMVPKVVYDVTGENTASDSVAGIYAGVYWQPAYQGLSTGTILDEYDRDGDGNTTELDFTTILNRTNEKIVMINSNSYRFAVTTSQNVTNGVHDIFVSDNAFSDETIRKLWDTFGTNDGSKDLEVYGSSINRTSSKNAKNGEQYWKHMDTAYKFWETTVRGYTGTVKDLNGKNFRVRDWASAPAIMGGVSAGSSVINYYDNTFIIPKGNSKKIYVRHIDVTGLSDFKSTDINNSMVITGINNGQIIEIKQAEKNGKLQFSQYRWPLAAREQVYSNQKFNEVYELNLDTKNWIVGNIKYTNSTSYVDDSGAAKTVSYLNGTAYTEAEQNVLNNYNCVGGAVGYGDSLDNAIIAKNNNIDTAKFAGGDWANVYVNGADTINDYVVIDFYYEKKPTDIYVRHIDITNETYITDGYLDSFLQTNVGRSFKLNKNDWNYSIGNVVANRNIKPDRSAYTYQEHYTKNASEVLRIANIKYDHDTAGSYWDLLSSSQKTTYKEYTCVGAAVGKANTVDWAEVNKAQVKTNNSVNTKADFVNLKSENTIKLDNMLIEKNSDYTSIVVNNNDYNVVVIDFYYIKESVPSSPGRNNRQVYVRHVDMTGKTINSTNVEKAIAEGKVLSGTGKAQRLDNNRYVYKLPITVKGYQELFEMSAGVNLKISKDSNADYNCVGSNITASTTSLDDTNDTNSAKYKMNSILSRGTYSSTGTYKEYRRTDEVNSTNTVILIDFYYRSKHTGTALDRPTKGRLSFYTLNSANSVMLSGDSSTKSNINNATTSDSATVYDVVPSGESLKMSIDNAYVYMLGGINIKEQKIQDTYTFNYTITQNYKVNYLDWSSSCSGPCNGTYGDKKTGYCGRSYTSTCSSTCSDGKGGSYSCTVPCPKTCTESWTATSKLTTTVGSISRTYTYQIPYEYTFYKVKNMRLYNITSIELQDGYNNKGLPLFDGETHVVTPTTTYTNSFSKTNSTFTQSKSNQSPNRTSDTLDTTLVYYHDNQDGDVTTTTASSTARSSINTMFNNITHSMAAEMKDFKVTESSYASGKVTNYSYSGISTNTIHNRLYMKFYVKNDEVSFVDKVDSRTIKIVGEGNDLSSRAKSSGDSTNEMNAVKFIDLVEYTKNKTRLGTSTTYTYTVNDTTDKVEITTQYPKSIRGTSTDAKGSKYLPTSYLTDKDYYNEVSLNIPTTRLNGKRYSYGKIYYNLLENGNNNLNFDADDKGVVTCTDSNKSSCHDWNNNTGRKAASGGGTQSFVDTEMYNTSGVANPSVTTLISPSTLGEVEMDYGKNNNGTSNDADIVDVFTPISFKTWIVTGQAESSNKQVDHTTQNSNDETIQIQKNSRFTIAMEPTSQNAEYDNTALSTDKYLMQYYIKFDFDVQDIKIYDARNTSGRNYSATSVTAGTWIGPIYNQYGSTNVNGAARVSAFALADPNQATIESIVNQETNNYTIRAVAYNAPNSLIYDLARGSTTLNYLVDNLYNRFSGTSSTSKSHSKYYDQTNIEGHSNYIAELSVETENLSRVYDFKVTDLKDLDWKDIFRKSTTTTTNVHTSKAYYSGIKKWNVYTTQSNQLLNRDASEIGSTKQQILPLGPYKNTNTTYVKAPKLGYKFSFDLKTTGAIDTDRSGNLSANKKVVITPSFYYISNDLDPANHSKPKIEKEIELYYKNSSNKYVSIDNYNLYFVPDDGYRLTFEGTDAAYRFSNSSLSKSTVKLGTAKELTLTSKMMEQADNMFVQIWYGEYKLPNSTIAVKKGGDINEDRLTDGYIGVKFDIKVIEYNSSNMVDSNIKRILNYNQKDGNASGNNTTQWDYEGYLGYDFSKKNGSNITASDNIRLALEGMSWRLDQSDYEFIRGTVILYDTDAKASSDYE